MIKNYKKQRFYQKLDTQQVYLVDNSLNSSNYFSVSDLPKKLVSGKNSFKIKANNKNLKIGSNILFEVIDQNKNVIYSETHEYTDRLGKKIITIYVYPDNTNSIAQITLLGIATKNALQTNDNKLSLKEKLEIPSEWRDRYNVKWIYKLSVDSLEKNNNEIILNAAPNITATEIFKQQNYFTYTHNSVIESRTNAITVYTSSDVYSASYKSPLSLQSISNNYQLLQSNYTKFGNGINTSYNTNSADVLNSNAVEYKTLFDKRTNDISNVIQSTNEFYYNEASYPVITLYSQSNPTPTFEFEFTKKMIGGTLNIFNPNSPYPSYTNYLSSDDELFSATIVDVLNKNQVQVALPYNRKIKDSTNKIQDVYFKQFENSQFQVTYSSDYSNSNSEARKNYAEIIITDLDLISGDIYRIKPYVKSVTDASDYIPQTDIIIESKNILLSTSSIKYEEPLGNFISQDFIDTYWDIDNLSNAATVSNEYINTILLNGLHIYTNVPITTGFVGISQALTNTHCHLYLDNYYEISLNIHGKKNVNNDNQIFEIIGHGTSFDSDYPVSEPVGTLIGKVQIPSTSNEVTYKNLTFGFTPNRTGLADFAFVIRGGDWTISDVQINSVKLSGFTPTQLKFLVPLQPIWDNDTLNFKFELYSSNGTMANQILLLNNVKFDHGYSHFIQGQYNLITGSAWLGKTLNSGIELTGKNSGIVKSVGYDGWNAANAGTGAPGFLMWSGSFGLNASGNLNPTSYSGVGIELHGGHHTSSGDVHALHFDTVTGMLQVTGSIIATDAVFENYAIADYLGSRVLVINSLNKSDYCKNYFDGNISYSYLDLSAEVTDSAMFVRFEDIPDYPITHIQIPEMYSFTDEQIGGTIITEFSSDLGSNYVYFYEHTESFDGNGYTPSNANLQLSNAIRNYTGSFTYLGFGQSITGHSNLLMSRKGARYNWSKGSDGFGLLSATNYDNINIMYKDMSIQNQWGTRRNVWIRPQDITVNLNAGTVIADSWNSLPCLNLSSATTESFGPISYYNISQLSFEVFVPEFIINKNCNAVHYFSYNGLDSGKLSRFIIYNQTASVFKTYLDGTFTNISSYTSLLNASNFISSINANTIYSPNLPTTASGIDSADVINWRFDIGYSGSLSINYLGSRISFDYGYNYGGWDSGNYQPIPPASHIFSI